MAQGKPWPSLMGSVALGTPRFLSCEVGTIGPHSTPPRWSHWKLSPSEMGREHVADLLLTKVPKTFMLINSLHDKNNVGLSFYGRP